MSLPPYNPPSARHAAVAAGCAPLGVLLAFTLLVLRVIDADTTLAALLALTVWVVVELHRFQRAIDRYNADYAGRHLAWRTPQTLRLLAADPQLAQPTRAYVQHYLDSGCQVLRDGQAV